LASTSAELRAKAAHIVGTIAQNNPPVQAFCLRANLLKVLIQMTNEDPEVSVRTKALLALSGTGDVQNVIVRPVFDTVKYFAQH
jgi:hypothetical protein